MNIIVTPKRRFPAVLFIFVIEADVYLMLRPVQQCPRHIRVALVDRMEPSIAQFGRPFVIKPLLYFGFKACNFRFADVSKTIDTIGIGYIGAAKLIKVNKLPRKILGHVIIDDIVEHRGFGIGFLAFPFEGNIEIDRFFRFQVRIANPVPAIAATAGRPVHFPVVIEFAHARFGIACADIDFQTAVSIAVEVVRHAQISRPMGAKQITMVYAKNRRNDSVIVDLPRILNKGMATLNTCFTTGYLIIPRIKIFTIIFSIVFNIVILAICTRCSFCYNAVISQDWHSFICINNIFSIC